MVNVRCLTRHCKKLPYATWYLSRRKGGTFILHRKGGPCEAIRNVTEKECAATFPDFTPFHPTPVPYRLVGRYRLVLVGVPE